MPPLGTPPHIPTNDRRPGVRDFARSINVSSIFEKITLLAYHSKEINKEPSFTAKEMSVWFGLCGFQKPAQMAVALSDTRRRLGYIDNKGRDQWVITTAGENFVLNLLEGKV